MFFNDTVVREDAWQRPADSVPTPSSIWTNWTEMSRVGERSIMVKKKKWNGESIYKLIFNTKQARFRKSLVKIVFHIQPGITTTGVFTLEFQFQIQWFFSKHCYIVEPLRGVAPDLEPPNSVGTFDESS